MIALWLAWMTVAQATPVALTHAGRVLDAAGSPLNGEHAVTVGLYPQATGGSARHEETLDLVLRDGYFTVVLGVDGDLDHTALDVPSLWVDLRLDRAPLGPRQQLGAVPLAAVAMVARSVDSGVPGGTRVLSDGTLVLGIVQGSTCAPDGALALDSGVVQVCLGGSWRSVGNQPPEITAVNGPLGGRVEPGATVPMSAIGSDPDSDTLSWTWSFIGPATGWSLAGAASASPTITAPASLGALSQVTVRATVSDGSASTYEDITVVLLPETSCKGYVEGGRSRGSGLYWIAPDGVLANAWQVQCEMSLRGGGWTTCLAVVGGNASGTDEFRYTYQPWGSTRPARGTAGNICARVPATEVFGESWANGSVGSPEIRTGAIPIDGAAWTLGTFRGYSNGSDCVGFNHRSSMQPNQIGGTACGTLGNGLGHASGIAVSNGSAWRGVHGALNSGQYPYDQHMCDLSTWCGNGNTSAWLVLFSR